MLKPYVPTITHESWDSIYSPLVGSPEDIHRLHNYIAEGIPNVIEEGCANDPYRSLLARTLGAINEASGNMPRGYARDTQQDLINSSAYIGMSFTTAILRGLGNTYAQKAKVPQNYQSVRKDTVEALLDVHDVARLGPIRGSDQSFRMINGKDKLGPVRKVATLARVELNSKLGKITDIKPRAYDVKTDEAGQLTVRLKASETEPVSGEGHCPAMNHLSKINGERHSSLLLLMGVVGDVAVEKIYPQYFEILGLPERS